MKKLKRIAAVFLAGVLALSMLAGCAQSGKDEFGEYLVDGVLMSIGNRYLGGEKCKNDPDLEKELKKWIVESVDPETFAIRSDVNYVPVYTPDEENPKKISFYAILKGSSSVATDFNLLKMDMVSAIGWLTGECGSLYGSLPDDFDAELTKFAVTYQVITDQAGKEHLIFAYGLVMTPKAS